MATPYDARPWLKFYASGVPHEVDIPEVPLTQLLDDSARRFPRRAALAFFGRTISYRQLVDAADRFADALRGLGVHREDRVALIMPNCPQQVIAFYGILRRGAVVVQHNPLYTAAELRHQLSDSGAKVAIVYDGAYETLMAGCRGTALEHIVVTSLAEFLPRVKRLALRLPLRKAREARAQLITPVPDDPGTLYFRDLLRRAKPRHHQVPVQPKRDLAALQYTGGTTGRPKGAMLTHYNLLANAYQTAAWDPSAKVGQETTLAVLPLFHVFGLTLCLTTSTLVGATVVLVPKFDVDLVLDAIRKWKPTVFPGVPPIFQQLTESPRAARARMNSIRTCISGAMKLPRETVEAFRKATSGAEVSQGYGMTETSPVALANPLDGNARHISVGIPLPGTYVRIVSENDPRRAMPVGEAGELLIYGPQVFRGYWNQPRETAEVLMNGWLRTGDIGLMSPDGFFTLIDRKRDVIIINGLNVYPSEVEEVLSAHPAVTDCAVVSVPDERYGELVKAFVIPVAGMSPDPAELITFCARRLAEYKVPALIEFRETLPRNILGKVLRRVLREEDAQGTGPQPRADTWPPAWEGPHGEGAAAQARGDGAGDQALPDQPVSRPAGAGTSHGTGEHDAEPQAGRRTAGR
jgi:long-chain acyl-CoA synthetase